MIYPQATAQPVRWLAKSTNSQSNDEIPTSRAASAIEASGTAEHAIAIVLAIYPIFAARAKRVFIAPWITTCNEVVPTLQIDRLRCCLQCFIHIDDVVKLHQLLSREVVFFSSVDTRLFEDGVYTLSRQSEYSGSKYKKSRDDGSLHCDR